MAHTVAQALKSLYCTAHGAQLASGNTTEAEAGGGGIGIVSTEIVGHAYSAGGNEACGSPGQG